MPENFLHFRLSETEIQAVWKGLQENFLQKQEKPLHIANTILAQRIVAILDENGNMVVSYGYDAWGAPLWCTGELAETLGKVQPFRYRGYVFDEETGLYYLRSRYYNPQQLRWINSDNIIAVNSGFTAANNYVYCGNSPINRYDANGRSWKDVVRGLIHRGNECLMSLGVDTTSIGAFLLMMEEVPADSGIYHAKENCWQQFLGITIYMTMPLI